MTLFQTGGSKILTLDVKYMRLEKILPLDKNSREVASSGDDQVYIQSRENVQDTSTDW